MEELRQRHGGNPARATFSNVGVYGANRYMVKKEIKWQLYIGGDRWRTDDPVKTETPWIRVDNPSWDFVTSIGDRTVWGISSYNRAWRAVITFKLIKNRPGPRDKNVETVELVLRQGQFTERGSCRAPGGPAPQPGFG